MTAEYVCPACGEDFRDITEARRHCAEKSKIPGGWRHEVAGRLSDGAFKNPSFCVVSK